MYRMEKFIIPFFKKSESMKIKSELLNNLNQLEEKLIETIQLLFQANEISLSQIFFFKPCKIKFISEKVFFFKTFGANKIFISKQNKIYLALR